MAKNDLQGALDLLILKSLSDLGSMHGFGIILHIERVSDELLNVEEGSLYPALHRMEQSGWVRSEWAVTESSRKALWVSSVAYGLLAGARNSTAKLRMSFENTFGCALR
jgi:PadR family transcriptional regulator, regulatory protein PadR